MQATEKNFDETRRIVDAIPTLRGAVFHFAGMGCFGVVLCMLFATALRWLAESLGETFRWLAKAGSVFLSLLCLLLLLGAALTMQDSLRNIRLARQLRRKGVRTTAVVVGREKVEHAEEDILYVFYQFRPDFVVRLQDSNHNPVFYPLPLGSKVSVVYLAERPEVSTLVV